MTCNIKERIVRGILYLDRNSVSTAEPRDTSDINFSHRRDPKNTSLNPPASSMKRKREVALRQWDSVLKLLETDMRAAADASKAAPMEKYLKHNFQFLGIAAPERKAVYKIFRERSFAPQTESELIAWVDLLWEQPYREYQHYALMELERHTTLITLEGARFVASLVVRRSWWDTVDMLASNILGKYYHSREEELRAVLPSWTSHGDMWMNRTALLVQLKFKADTHVDLLEASILRHSESEQFFHQKAIGWALREYAKTNPVWVRAFVQQHRLKPLSVREALKHISKS
jgi:3-methyladenine DNA glycosylase AlkD